MPRRSQRLIATLLIWIAILITVGVVVSRIAEPPVETWNAWYGYGNIVADGNAEAAAQTLNDISQMGSTLWQESRLIAMELYGQYAAWLLVIIGILLTGGIASTYLLWRGVYLPERIRETDQTLPRASKRHSSDDELADDYASEQRPLAQRRAR
jgi:hypothetical protein